MKYILSLTCLMFSLQIFATDAEITNCVFTGNPGDKQNPSLTAWFTLSWKNAWRNERNHDAVWVFFKLNASPKERMQLHGFIKQGTAQLIHNYLPATAAPAFRIPADGAGIMLYASAAHRGNITWRIKAELDVSKINGLNTEDAVHVFAHAIEMVHVPKGSFYLGETDTASIKHAASFFEAGSNDYYHVTSENKIDIGTQKGNLNYFNDNQPEYRGDMKGPLPEAFPKGYRGFYMMKYELTDGLYASFLNSAGNYYAPQRANFAGNTYYENRGSIYYDGKKYATKSPSWPAGYTSWDDECAFADWAALRPMTEFEFEKACRGPQKPTVQKDYPWGNASREKVSRYFDDNNDLVNHPSLNESMLANNNLEFFGASYYWVMDLNKSLWERCVSAGSEKGRAFRGTHGDGRLGGYLGNATNEDWPNGMDGKGGIGYRGGGVYEKGMVGSPEGNVGDRPFAAWGDAPRTIAYGFRAVRSAEE